MSNLPAGAGAIASARLTSPRLAVFARLSLLISATAASLLISGVVVAATATAFTLLIATLK